MSNSTVLLVHGAWHGAWCWSEVVAALGRGGFEALAIELPLTSLEDDVAEVRRAVRPAAGTGDPVVLCGHSYGGTVITAAGDELGVAQLVYLCAVVPDAGEATLVNGKGSVASVADADGATSVADPLHAATTFYNRCEPSVAAAAVDRLRPMALRCFTAPAALAAWRTKPSVYVRCEEDRALPGPRQVGYAARCSRSLVWDSDHSPFLSRPEQVAALLADVASAR